MKRRVAQLVAPKKFEIIEEDVPKVGANDVLIKVIATGLCHSDMPAYMGQSNIGSDEKGNLYMEKNLQWPVRVGHEPVGEIIEVGSNVTEFKPGDIVGGPVMESFASHVVANKGILAKVPDSVENPEYCLPEPLMCISNIVRVANPGFGDTLAVVGCGMMGLLSIAGLAQSEAKEIVGIDLLDNRLEMAKEMGATTTINPKKEDVVEKIMDMTDGRGAEIVIEITGSLKGLKTAADIVLNAEMMGYQGRGDILIPTLYAFPEEWDPELGYQLMFKSPVLHSTHPWYSEDYIEDLKRGVWGYASGRMPLDKLITHEFSLDEIEEAFEYVETGKDGYIKGIVKP